MLFFAIIEILNLLVFKMADLMIYLNLGVRGYKKVNNCWHNIYLTAGFFNTAPLFCAIYTW